MGGRIFDPAIGRFLSADPVVKGMGSTDAYNRYSYVGNNPMSYTDPTGYFTWVWEKGAVGAALHGMRGATFAAINGHDISSGLIGGATEGALGGAISRFTVDSRTGQMAIAAMVSGTVSEVSGGNFATGAVTGAMGYLFNELGERRRAARAASAASLVLDVDGGIAMLMDGRRTYDEALQLRNFVMDAPLMDFLGIFPELSNRGLADIRLIRESMRVEIQAVGIQGLNRMVVGGGGLANDIAIGMSVSAAASVIGVSYQTVALIELSLAVGASMHQRDHRAPLVDKIREKYIR